MSEETTTETPAVDAAAAVGDAVAQAAAELERIRVAGKAAKAAEQPEGETHSEGEEAAAAPPAEDVTEAPVAEEADVKARARGRIARQMAEAKKAKEEAESIRAEARAEAERIKAEVAKERAEFDALKEAFRSKPDEFLAKSGWDLTEMVQAKLDEGKPEAQVTALQRKLDAVLERLESKERAEQEREAKAAKEREEATEKERMAALEKAYIEGVSPEAHPRLARLVKRNQMGAMAMSYTMAHKFRQDHGRNPTDDEIRENVELDLAGLASDDEATVTLAPTKGKKVTPRDAAAPTGGPADFSKMSEDEKAAYAEKELERMRLARKRATS
jgi:hypothetical protein